jgi:transposase ISL3 family protein
VWVTHRLALYIHQLSQFMTVSEVAKHVKLDWKTVKNIDKMHSQADQIPRKKGTG